MVSLGLPVKTKGKAPSGTHQIRPPLVPATVGGSFLDTASIPSLFISENEIVAVLGDENQFVRSHMWKNNGSLLSGGSARIKSR